MEPLLEIRNLQLVAAAGGPPLLEDVSLQVEAGTTLGLLGASGSGKSMTSLAVLGLLPPGVERTRGQIFFAGRRIDGLAEAERRRLRGGEIALIFQDPLAALDPVMRIGKQIREVLQLRRNLAAAPCQAEVLRLLAEVQLTDVEALARSYPHQLSGGQRQRVLIAMALAGEPRLLIADEPTTALDVTIQAEILALVARIQQQRGLSMLWISHDLEVLAQCCQRLAVLHQGVIVEEGETNSVLSAPQHAYTRRLLAARPRREHSTPVDSPKGGDSAPVLRVSGLQVRYPARHDWMGRVREWKVAVHALDLELHAGECLALVGESGSGKSSTARALLRLHPAAAGQAWLQPPGEPGHDLLAVDAATLRRLRPWMSMVFQDPRASLDPRMAVWRSVAEPLQIQRRLRGDALRQRVDDLLRQVQLDPALGERRPGKLSGGQCQRVAIARALALDPCLLICDEAVSALDLEVQKEILELLDALRRARRLACLFITHDLSVVAALADRVAVMKEGQVVEQGSVEQVFTAAQHPYTQQLLAAAPRVSC